MFFLKKCRFLDELSAFCCLLRCIGENHLNKTSKANPANARASETHSYRTHIRRMIYKNKIISESYELKVLVFPPSFGCSNGLHFGSPIHKSDLGRLSSRIASPPTMPQTWPGVWCSLVRRAGSHFSCLRSLGFILRNVCVKEICGVNLSLVCLFGCCFLVPLRSTKLSPDGRTCGMLTTTAGIWGHDSKMFKLIECQCHL